MDRSFEINSSDSSSLGQGSFSKFDSATGTPCSCTVTTSGNVDAYRKLRAYRCAQQVIKKLFTEQEVALTVENVTRNDFVNAFTDIVT